MTQDLKVFAGRSNPRFAEAICGHIGVPLGQIEITNFMDGEIYVHEVGYLDVPFFLTAAAAWAEGKGDTLAPLPPLEGLGIVLVNPGFPVSTAWAYGKVTFGLTKATKALSMLRFLLEMKRFTEIGPHLHNDFEPLVERSYPDVAMIKEALSEGGALGVALSGSGPTVFGLFPDAVPADVTSGLARPGWTVVATEPITDWEKVFVVPLETAGDGEACSPGRASGG